MGKMSHLALLFVLFLSVLTPASGQSGEEMPKFQMLLGPVVGMTYVVDAQGTLDAKLQEMYPNPDRSYTPFFTQFGVNLEQRLRLGTTRSYFAFQEVFAVGGMDQGIFLPSVSFFLGFRSHRGLQFGLGPNLVVRWAQSEPELATSVTYAVGWSFPFYGAFVPVSLAFSATSEDGNPRIGLISGFNFEVMRKTGLEVGTVFVETDPPGAEVLLDGVHQGVSPVRIPDVPLGVVQIEGRKEAFYGMKKAHVGRGLTKLVLVLAEQYGILHIKSSERAVEVFLDGKKLGRLGSGLFERTPVGRHELELKAWGLYWAGEAEIRRREITQVEASPRAFGSVAYSLPEGVRADIQGEAFQRTVEGRGTLEPLWVGAFTVQTASDLYEPYAAELFVERGKQIALSPALIPTAEYEYQQLSQRLEAFEEELSGADVGRLEALRDEIRSARHEHPQLLSRSGSLLSRARERAEEAARQSGSVFVETDPPGAEVFLNGVKQGVSPVLIPSIPLGVARIESRKGSFYGMEELQVVRGVAKLSLALVEQYGALLIQSSNYAVEVFLDGEKLGRLGSGGSALFERTPAGLHKLELKGWGLYWAGEAAIQPEQITRVEASPRAFGSIAYSLPEGVRVAIRGESFQQTVQGEGILTPVWEGSYTARLESETHEPYSAEVVVERGKEVTLSPELIPAAEYEYQQLSRRLD